MMTFKTALLYPPIADFTQPHPAIPYLAAFLREKNEDVIIKDMNIEANDQMLHTHFLTSCQQMVESKFDQLEKKPYLELSEHTQYQVLLEALGVDSHIISNIDQIKQSFKDADIFYDYEAYSKNLENIKQAFQLISSAYHPMKITPGEYTTPYFLSSQADIETQCQLEINPLASFYQNHLIPWIQQEKPDLIGFSVTYPTQILQMFTMAYFIRTHFSNIHLCAGGAFICRMVLNMPKNKHHMLFEYLDSIVLYEGESALYHLIQHLKSNNAHQSLGNTILYDRKNRQIHYPSDQTVLENMDALPPPDYDGYPLHLYLSPRIVLPYAPTRGCYWNRCTFCHYGATGKGTLHYREKKIEQIIADLDHLNQKYSTGHFAFSVDVIHPKTLLRIAKEMIARKRSYLWTTDCKVDDFFSEQNCQILRQGGCLSVAIGLESANQRILNMMDKGISPDQAKRCIRNFSTAGIATQVMTFLNFPTEIASEAMETIKFIQNNMAHISLFTMGDFVLHEGSKIYQSPEKYDIERLFYLNNDEFKIFIQYEAKRPSKMHREKMQMESAYNEIAMQYVPQDPPFVGGVSNNHTLLYFEQFGKNILKQVHSETDETYEMNKFEPHDIPVLRPEIKAISTNYCLSELEHILESNTYTLAQTIQNRNSIQSSSVRTYPKKTMYLLIQSMNWMETPQQAKYFLRMCNGKNSVADIVNSIDPNAWDVVSDMLNKLFTYKILDKKQ
jgi:radical SAM superfamily enzyme YgiQ (UPF0313 family)